MEMDASKAIFYYISIPCSSLKRIQLNKLQLFFIFILSINIVFSQDYDPSKKLTIHADNQSIAYVLSEITQKSGLNFSYNSNVIETNENITFHAIEKTINEVLEALSEQLTY